MKSRTGGSSLIEVVVSITILGLIVAPLCASLVTAHRINAKSEALLREQLAASNAIESLQASGIDGDNITGDVYTDDSNTLLNGVTVTAAKENATDTFYTVTVKSGDVTFTTVIREEDAS